MPRSLPSQINARRAMHPFSRSYGVILQSSLRRVLPITLVFSTRLPASVCGTGTLHLTRGFSRQLGSPHLPHCCVSHSVFTLTSRRICLSDDGYDVRRTELKCAWTTRLGHPFVDNDSERLWNV